MRWGGPEAVLCLGAALIPAPSGAQLGPPLTQPACEGTAPKVSTFYAGGPPIADWRENLAFDGPGHLWVSNQGQNRIERFNPQGELELSADFDQPAGIVRGPDGLIYRATGEACVLVNGLSTPTSLRYPSKFAHFFGKRDIFVTEASGSIVQVRLPPA